MFKTDPIGPLPHRYRRGPERRRQCRTFVAIDRASNFAHAEPHERATRGMAADVLGRPIAIVPHKICAILTDNGKHFTVPGNQGSAVADIKLAIERGPLPGPCL